MIEPKSIIIDAKSGVTGAGRVPSQATHFPDCNENLSPYKIASHRHTPEIEQTLSHIAEENITITFAPHLLPVNRGILSTIYAQCKDECSTAELHKIYMNFYAEEHFIRIMPLGQTVNINQVKHSNYCDISLHADPKNKRVILASVLDNMVKGAAGQAVQNMNIALGFPETAGLEALPTAF
jgi:N-acetyl-gamma-glutamyl-phosphate reductase